ncbi:hypothetical protein C0R00_21195 [Streptomyces albidoflavus]|nr:hypothetical protein C0R00_21195 [Streptomyces albidoflavus]
MSAGHVVGLVGIVVITVGVLAIAHILRGGTIISPVVTHPTCADCGHILPEHWGGGRCHHDFGHHTWNNDSYGNSQRRFGDVCGCGKFRAKEAGG